MRKTFFFVAGMVVLFIAVGCNSGGTPSTPAQKCVGDKCPVGTKTDVQVDEAIPVDTEEVTGDEHGRPQRKHRLFKFRQK